MTCDRWAHKHGQWNPKTYKLTVMCHYATNRQNIQYTLICTKMANYLWQKKNFILSFQYRTWTSKRQCSLFISWKHNMHTHMPARIKPYSCNILEMANKNYSVNCNTSHVTEHYTKYSTLTERVNIISSGLLHISFYTFYELRIKPQNTKDSSLPGC